MSTVKPLISYTALSAPASLRPAAGTEAFLRPDIGFSPNWFSEVCGVSFGRKWHFEPEYRRETIAVMAASLRKRFPASQQFGGSKDFGNPPDLLSGTFGNMMVPSLFGVPITWPENDWPRIQTSQFLNDQQARRLEPPDLDNNPFWNEFLEQLDWIARESGAIEGYLNWQGVLANANHLRGFQIFADIKQNPDLARHVFACVTAATLDAVNRLYSRQKSSSPDFFAVSNQQLNIVAPEDYNECLFPYDSQLAGAFSTTGIQNGVWKADSFLEYYSQWPNVGYVDVGIHTNLQITRITFPKARRGVVYSTLDLENKTYLELTMDFERIARECGPCDVVCSGLDPGLPDSRINEVYEICEQISARYG